MSNLKVGSNATDSLRQAEKTIQSIKRQRRQRLTKFREMFREDEESNARDRRTKWGGLEVVCPICRLAVRGDEDVVDAHVDACLAGEVRRSEEERGYESEGGSDGAAGHVGDVRGMPSYPGSTTRPTGCRNGIPHAQCPR